MVSRDIPDGCRGTSRTTLSWAFPLRLVVLGQVDGVLGEEFALAIDDTDLLVVDEEDDLDAAMLTARCAISAVIPVGTYTMYGARTAPADPAPAGDFSIEMVSLLSAVNPGESSPAILCCCCNCRWRSRRWESHRRPVGERRQLARQP